MRRYVSGEDAASIARELGRSERWVFKWAARYYDTGEAEWFASRDRRPRRSPTATAEEMVALVLAARDRLEADPRAQRGQAAIAWELLAMGVPEAELPKPWTIERIIRRAGRSKPRRRERGRYEPKGTPYPRHAAAARPGVLHQIDPLGPR